MYYTVGINQFVANVTINAQNVIIGKQGSDGSLLNHHCLVFHHELIYPL